VRARAAVGFVAIPHSIDRHFDTVKISLDGPSFRP
jgi:hypothetical protein